MNLKFRKLTAAAMAAAMVLGMTGCGNAAGEPAKDETAAGDDVTQGETEFKFITAMSDTGRSEIIDTVVAKLQEKYPNVTFTNDSGDDYNNKAKLAFSSGTPYSLVFTDDLGLTALREAGYLMDLSSYIAERGWDEKQVAGATDFYNQRTPGEQYTVGMNYAPVVVYYNKTIFSELGLEVPTTTAEYENILKTATEHGYIGAENCKDNINAWYIESLVQNIAPFEDVLDWYYLRESGDGMKNAFTQAAETVKKWSDAGYFRKDYEGIDYGDVTSLFGQGQTATAMDGNWFLYEYESTGLDVGVFAFPGVSDSAQDNYIINPVDAAFAVSKDVDETQLAVALDFIDLMMTPEIAEMWLAQGSIPSLNHTFSDETASALTQELLTVVQNTKSGFYLDNARPGLLELMLKEIQLFVSGDESVEDMWNRIDEFWREG